MKLVLLKKIVPFYFILIVAILLFTLNHSMNLRALGYYSVPDTHSLLDERTWVWQGLSIRNTGIPAGWSDLGVYQEGWKNHPQYNKGHLDQASGFNISFDNNLPSFDQYNKFPKPLYTVIKMDTGLGDTYLNIVQPLIEQPPLGGLILGSLISSKNKTFSDISSVEYRKMSLYLAFLTQILIFILGWQIFKKPLIGLIASIVYGSVPSFLIVSRLALLESVITPFLLLSVIFILLANSTNPQAKLLGNRIAKQTFLLGLAGIFSGLMALVKVTGFPMILIGVVIMMLLKLSFKNFLVYLSIATSIGLLFFVWLFSLDALPIFLNILRYQGIERLFFGSMNFLTSLVQIRIANFPFDGWWLGGIITLLFLPRIKQYGPIFIGAGVSLFVALFFGTANYGWYYIPLIPFLCLSTAYFIYQVILSPSILSILTYFLIFFSSSFYWGYGVNFSLISSPLLSHLQIYRVFLLLFIFFAFILFFKHKSSLIKKTWIIFFVFILLLSYKFNDYSMYFIIKNWGDLPKFPF